MRDDKDPGRASNGVGAPGHRHFLGTAGMALGLRVLGAVASFGFSVFLSRLLGAEGAGEYFLGLGTVTVLGSVASLGLELVVIRRVAEACTLGKRGQALETFRAAALVCLAAGLILSVLLVSGAGWIAETAFHNESVGAVLRAIGWGIPCYAALLVSTAALKGAGYVEIAVATVNVAVPAIMLGGLAVLHPGEPAPVGWLYVLAVLASALGAIAVFLGGSPAWDREKGAGAVRPSHLVREGLPLLVALLATQLDTWLPGIMLGRWWPESAVGAYTVAYRTAMLAGFGLLAVNAVAAPRFAALYAQDDHDGLARTARLSMLGALAVALPWAAACLLLPNGIMDLFGRGFRAGSTALMILAAGQLVNAAAGSVGMLLIAGRRESTVQRLAVGSTACMGLLCLALVPTLGQVGAALAVGTTLAGKNLVAVWLVRRELGIEMWRGRALAVPRSAGARDGRSD